MTITIPWYSIPIVLVVFAIIVPMLIPERGSFDFACAFWRLFAFVVPLTCAISFTLGRVFA